MELMTQLLDAKLQQVPEFKNSLGDSVGNTLVCADRYDLEWGTGLTEDETYKTKKRFWPGANLLGTMLESLRKKVVEQHARRGSQKI